MGCPLIKRLTIASSDLSCWKLSLSLRTSSANFLSEDSILLCIFNIIAINFCLLNLLKNSSVKDAISLNNKNTPSYNKILNALMRLSAIHPHSASQEIPEILLISRDSASEEIPLLFLEVSLQFLFVYVFLLYCFLYLLLRK